MPAMHPTERSRHALLLLPTRVQRHGLGALTTLAASIQYEALLPNVRCVVQPATFGKGTWRGFMLRRWLAESGLAGATACSLSFMSWPSSAG